MLLLSALTKEKFLALLPVRPVSSIAWCWLKLQSTTVYLEVRLMHRRS